MISYSELKPRIEKSKEKIKKAFNLFPFENISDIPIALTTYTYWLDGKEKKNKPYDYFYDSDVQLKHQIEGFTRHFENLDDDYIPYLMPIMGTCILQSIYGCEVKRYKNRDLTVTGTCIKDKNDLDNLKIEGNFENYWMTGEILNRIKYFRNNSDFPVSITDPQSPLDMLAQMIGHVNFCYFLKDYPQAIKRGLEVLNQTLIKWIKKQKEFNGEAINECHGALNGVPPKGIGVWVADDDSIWVNPDFYREMIVPLHSKLFSTFSAGILHYCGNSSQHIENFRKIDGLRGICLNSMGDLAMVRELQEKLGDQICIILLDICPIESELDGFLKAIKKKLIPRGLIIQMIIPEAIGAKNGGYVFTHRDPIKTANKILKTLRS
ncbi:MAG: hypothetical protein FJW63_03475 [Actinobacteria bacterium]|nr:hypothetical protein [Actinomycetota bacterium]